MAPPQLVSGAGVGESWDGVECTDMMGCDEKRAGGLWPQGAGKGRLIGVQRLREEYEQ